MKLVLVVARDALLAFMRQRLLLALVIGTLGFTAAFAYLTSWQEKTFENLNDVAIEELQAEGAQQGRMKLERAQLEQGLEQTRSTMQAFFLASASFVGNVVALILFVTLIASPLRRGEVRGVLTRPLRRSQYLLGRFLAGAAALGAYWFMMSLLIALFALYQQTPLPPTVGYAAVLYLSKSLMLGAIALALSLFLHPALAAVIALVASSDWVSSRSVLYYLLPGDDRLGIARQLLNGTVVSLTDVALALAYAINLTVVAVGVALLRFRRLDIV